jgi:hypothetical protein
MSEPHGAQLGPVMAFSANRDEVAHFYRDVAGMPADDAGEVTWFDAENAKLAIHDPQDRQTPDEVRKQPGFVLWLGVADVRLAYERAAKAGRVIGEFHGDFFYARDPDGRYVGFYALEEHGHDHDHDHTH